MLAAPSVLSQIYGVIPKPDAESAAMAIEAEAFAATSKFVAAESPTSVKEGATHSSHQVGHGRRRYRVLSFSDVSDLCFKCLI
jgi:hypothetical protein